MSKRGLSPQFINDLKTGILHPILNRVHSDNTLTLEIRDGYINLYYRGSSLIQLREQSKDYAIEFNLNYMNSVPVRTNSPSWPELLPKSISSSTHSQELVACFCWMKEGIDLTLSDKETGEREMQQLVIRENNRTKIANSTDYLIADIEYTHTDFPNLRLDMVSVFWPSNSQARQRHNQMQIGIIEMKYGDSALTGKAGIKKHINDMEIFAKHLPTFREEMEIVVKQKAELGLLSISALDETGSKRHEKIELQISEKPEWILLLANHDPESTKLNSELENLVTLSSNLPFEIKIATANFMGYGLYSEAIYTLEEFKEKFQRQVHSK